MTFWAIVYADYYTDEDGTYELDCGIEGIYESELDAQIILQELRDMQLHDFMKIEAW